MDFNNEKNFYYGKESTMNKWGIRKLMIFIILSATVAIAYQLPYLRYTFYDQMMSALNLNDVQMGVLASAVSIASTISYPIGGFLANRFSMRSLINLTLAAFVVLTVAFAFTTNYILLIGIHVLYGFFGIATLWSAYLVGSATLVMKVSKVNSLVSVKRLVGSFRHCLASLSWGLWVPLPPRFSVSKPC